MNHEPEGAIERARRVLAEGEHLRADVAERERVIRNGWHFDDALSCRDNLAALDAYERMSGSGSNATAHRAAPSQPRQTPAPVQKAAPPMLAETQAAWDRWAKAHIANALVKNNRELVKAVGEAMAMYVGKEVADVENRFRDEERQARGNLLTRVMRLEAERDGRSLSRIYPNAGA